MPLKRIPESVQSQVLSVALGKATGAILAAADKAIQECQKKLTKMCQEASEEIAERGITIYNTTDTTVTATGMNSEFRQLQAFQGLPALQGTLGTVKASLDKIQSLANPLKTTIKVVETPIRVLEALIMFIKLLPMPQMWLPVSFTTTYSELMIITMATIAQIKDIVSGLTSTLESFGSSVEPILEAIERVKGNVNTAEASEAFRNEGMTEEDLEILQKEGIIDPNTGQSLFDELTKIGSDLEGTETDGFAMYMGEKGTGIEDLSSQELRNRSYLAHITSGSIYVIKDVLGNVKVLNSGDEGSSLLEQEFLEIGQEGQIQTDTEKITKLSVVSGQDGFGKYQSRNSEEGTYIIAWAENSRDLLNVVVSKVMNLGVSKQLKDRLTKFMQDTQKQEIDTDGNSEFNYKGKDGKDYQFKLIQVTDTGVRAVQHYVEVYDDTGIVVLKGTKSFSSDTGVLVREMIFALDQLLG